ncbi:MAG TPA: right-handed parallel beta-helix repeat-containing protein, partial [Planctomycetaceae bacterium]|nr:right-handed parallel beta-helix repeat-containing protein [Planctomycetaceae bacterium]
AIPNAAFELGGLDFQALTKGPATVEGSRYANMLFGTTGDGRMYAFNTQGQLQPIFSEGATSIQLTDNEGTDLSEVRGLAFSELDKNLWGNNRGVMPDNVTPRDNDLGHGLPVTFNDSVRPFNDPVTTMPSTEADGGNSVNASYSFNAWHPHQNNSGSMNYTFNGGAYGSSISNEFSLKSYSSADLPVLYYTYFLSSESLQAGGHELRDSARVFIAGNDGDWQLLGGDDAEGEIADIRFEDVKDVLGHRMFDNTGGWRQVRINLSDYAGQDNLRLRFDFSTAGDMNVGDTQTTGDEMRAVAGEFITDGETFTVTRSTPAGGSINQVFEFDTGVTIFTEPGTEFADGDTLTITNNGVATTFEFDSGNGVTAGNVAVAFAPTDTAGVIATRLRSAILANVAGATVRYLGDDRLNLDFLDTAADTVTESSGGLTLFGQGGVTTGNIRVPVHREMTRDEVAIEMDKVLEPFLSVQTLAVRGFASEFNDGEQFRLSVGGQDFDFEFDNNSIVTPGFTAVTIGGNIPQMASNIRSAVATALTGSGHTATYNAADRARVALQGRYTEVFDYQVLSGFFPLSLQDPVDLVKTHKDLVRIIDETVVDAGPVGLENDLDGDLLGVSNNNGFFSNTRGQNNGLEGFYIDDIIIGLAERGEMVTGSSTNTDYIDNLGVQDDENLVGPYQLEMRRAATYSFPTIFGSSPSVNTNQRLNKSLSIVAPAGSDIIEGTTFTLSDSVHQVTFEFDFDGTVNQGNISVPFTADDTANVVAGSIRDAINSFPAQQAFDLSAQSADGIRTGLSTNNQVNLLAGHYSKYATFVSTGGLQVVFNNEEYGDNNRYRDQGQLILDGNRVSHSANWGIVVDDGARDSGAPHTGPARNLSQPNRTVPGVVISNNVVSNSGTGGIRYSGSANAPGDEVGSVPFGRIINNTLYGVGGASVGIQVDDNAAPTIVNNIVANFGTGVSVTNSPGTVLDYSVFQSNGNNGAVGGGGNNIFLQPTDPLFVNAAVGNFYPAPGSAVIDNSINTLSDRASMVTVRDPLGIPPSPILAPERDVTGSLRTDDESVVNQGGAGENPFKDRGAIDRVDFVGPTSELTNPLDNDPGGVDGDPTITRVSLGNISLFSFEVQLNDVGIGIDDLNVVSRAVKLEETFAGRTRTLVDGTDYVFSYDSTNNKIILRPTGGIWQLSRNYRITLDNTGTDGIRDLAGNLLQGNRVNGTVVYEILIGTAIDYGDAPASYGTLRAAGGPSHQIRAAYKLGTQVAPDLDGQPSATASADTFDDGLKSAFLSPGLTSTMTVLAQGGGRLDAWLDRNIDGDFLDAGEHILVGVTLPHNVQKTLSFTFGNKLDKKGDSFLRLRYTSAGI